MIESKTIFATAATIVGITGFIPYFKGMINKTTEPHPFTWLILIVTQGISTSILWFSGGGKGTISLAISTVLMAIVLIFSLFAKKKNIVKSDIIVLTLALSAIPIWLVLENPLIAAILLSSIDVSGYIPTFRKSYSKPRTESVWVWITFTISNIFAIFALKSYSPLTMIYLCSITSADLGLVLFILIRRKQLHQA